MMARTKVTLTGCLMALTLFFSSTAAVSQELKDDTNMFELGIFGGVFLPHEDHELFDEDFPHQPFDTLAADLGVRLSYLPLSFMGLEVEGAMMPTKVEDGGSATVAAVRGHLLLQIPVRVAPFILAGWGTMGVISDDSVLGKDFDYNPHFGVGVKLYATRYFAMRLDGRLDLGAKVATDEIVPHFEILLGASLVLGRAEELPPEIPDSDGDGYPDDQDACPNEPGIGPDGCPPKDSDGDGYTDDKDACPNEPGIGPDGCPPKDSDGDGFTDDKDACPNEPGIEPDGCPPKDSDGDGFFDDVDQCPTEPETRNGYQDQDGCPDELPTIIQKFTGTIKGITFRTGKSKIRRTSFRTLNKAVDVLQEYPDLKIVIRGHTDNRGKRDFNLDLSLARAEAVKEYLVDKGVDSGRISTEGLGPDEPIADNERSRGRAQNRRIEFKVVVE